MFFNIKWTLSFTLINFTELGENTAPVIITGALHDVYGNPVNQAPIALNAPGSSNIYSPGAPFGNYLGYTDDEGLVTWEVQYGIGVCSWIVGTEDPAQYEDFTSSVTATLMIAQSITSDPLDILLVRPADGP